MAKDTLNGSQGVSLHSFAGLADAMKMTIEPEPEKALILPPDRIDPEALMRFRALPLLEKFHTVVEYTTNKNNDNDLKKMYGSEVALEALRISAQERASLGMQIIILGPLDRENKLKIEHPEINSLKIFLIVRRESDKFDFIRVSRVPLIESASLHSANAVLEVGGLLDSADVLVREEPIDEAERLLDELKVLDELIGHAHDESEITAKRRNSSRYNVVPERIITVSKTKLNEIKDDIVLAFFQAAKQLYPTLPEDIKRIIHEDNFNLFPLVSILEGNAIDLLHVRLMLAIPAQLLSAIPRRLMKEYRRPQYSGKMFKRITSVNIDALADKAKGSSIGVQSNAAEICRILGL